MKNKKLSYILIPAVLLVWVIVGYKIYVKYVAEPEVLAVVKQGVTKRAVNKENTVFHLLSSYRDPFLGNSVAEVLPTNAAMNMVVERPDKITPMATAPQKVVVRWPNISIGGKVNQKALVNIGNRRFILAVGQEEAGVKLLRIAKDSLYLKYNGEQRSFVLLR